LEIFVKTIKFVKNSRNIRRFYMHDPDTNPLSRLQFLFLISRNIQNHFQEALRLRQNKNHHRVSFKTIYITHYNYTTIQGLTSCTQVKNWLSSRKRFRVIASIYSTIYAIFTEIILALAPQLKPAKIEDDTWQ
jgi:hypothetical protein